MQEGNSCVNHHLLLYLLNFNNMQIVGYVELSKDAQGTSPVPLERFQGKIVRVIEFTRDGGVMVVDSNATGIGMFDSQHVVRKMECTLEGEVVVPPGLNFMEKSFYIMRCLTRKGGYNHLLAQMVVHASLVKGKFEDSFLWAKQ